VQFGSGEIMEEFRWREMNRLRLKNVELTAESNGDKK
jgi:hypothetical protein